MEDLARKMLKFFLLIENITISCIIMPYFSHTEQELQDMGGSIDVE